MGTTQEFDKDAFDTRTRKAARVLMERLRASFSVILSHTDALRAADERRADWSVRADLLEAIRREGRQALQAIDSALDPNANRPRQPDRSNTALNSKAYVGWLRSRLESIESFNRSGQTESVVQLAQELKDSAASMGLPEISAAAAAVQRLSETPGQAADAAIEILRRIVSRALRNVGSDAA